MSDALNEVTSHTSERARGWGWGKENILLYSGYTVMDSVFPGMNLYPERIIE